MVRTISLYARIAARLLIGTWSGRWLLASMALAGLLVLVADGALRSFGLLLLIVLPIERLGWASHVSSNRRRRAKRQAKDQAEHAAEPVLPVAQRLEVRLAGFDDREQIAAVMLAPDAIEENGWGPDATADFAIALRTRLAFWLVHRTTLVATRRPTGEIVAVIRLSDATGPRVGGINVGLSVHPHHRAQGYGREALALFLASYSADAIPMWLGTAVTNRPMRRIMAALGHPEPTPEPHTLPNGEVIQSLWYRCRRLDPATDDGPPFIISR